MQLGNLLPDQEARIHLQLINVLKVEGGAYCFRFPIHYFPRFDDNTIDYPFSYRTEINSDSSITYLSHPLDCEVHKEGENGNIHKVVLLRKSDTFKTLKKDLAVYYRTKAMETPVLYAQ